MTPSQSKAWANALHQAYALSEVSRLCAAGIDTLDEKFACSAAKCAFDLLSDELERIAGMLDGPQRS